MKIALDYDGTYTEDKAFWLDFINRAQKSGHKVFVVTYRHPLLDTLPDEKPIRNFGVPVIYTDGHPKKAYCESQDILIDVWIDDRPQTVYEPSPWQDGDPRLTEWRENNRKASMEVYNG